VKGKRVGRQNRWAARGGKIEGRARGHLPRCPSKCRTIHHGINPKDKRGAGAPHREHLARPTTVFQPRRIRAPQERQVSGRGGASSTIRAFAIGPTFTPKARTCLTLRPIGDGDSRYTACPRATMPTKHHPEAISSDRAGRAAVHPHVIPRKSFWECKDLLKHC
jgi:hypothetical protein